MLSKVCTSWMLALKGHRQYPHLTPAFPVNPLPETQSCFPPMAHCWQEWVRARRKRDHEDKWWRTETWLDVTYLLSKLSWGRTGGAFFFLLFGCFFFLSSSCFCTLKARQAPLPLANTTPPHPPSPSPTPPPSPSPSWHTNRAFPISVDKHKYSQ